MSLTNDNQIERYRRAFLKTVCSHGYAVNVNEEATTKDRSTSTQQQPKKSPFVASAPSSCPDDVLGIFQALREKHLKFVRNNRTTTTTTGSRLSSSIQQSSPHESSSSRIFLNKHTFAMSIAEGIQPGLELLPLEDQEKQVTRLVTQATLGASADATGLVKRFRRVTGQRVPSAEDMRSALYDTDVLFRDDRLTDLVIFHTACSLDLSLVVLRGCYARIYPADASVRDRALLLHFNEEDAKYVLMYPTTTSTSGYYSPLLVVLKRVARECCPLSSASDIDTKVFSMVISGEEKEPPGTSSRNLIPTKATELRALLTACGIGAKQLAEISGNTEGALFTKDVMRTALDTLLRRDDEGSANH